MTAYISEMRPAPARSRSAFHLGRAIPRHDATDGSDPQTGAPGKNQANHHSRAPKAQTSAATAR